MGRAARIKIFLNTILLRFSYMEHKNSFLLKVGE